MQIARAWRQQPSNLRLVGSRCPKCEALLFPERIRCERCGETELEAYAFGGLGKVFSHSQVHEAPCGFESQVPYVAALVRLDEGPLVATMLADVDPEEVRVGMEVEMVTRRILVQGDDGPITYAYKFAPVLKGI